MEENNKEKKDASFLSTDLSDLKINKQTIDLLVANVIPTTKYFESRFDHMQYQISEIKANLSDLKGDMTRRFENVDKQFVTMQTGINKQFEAAKADVDKRFENIDKRFENIDKRFENIDKRFENIDKRFENVDKRFENIDKRFVTMQTSMDKQFEAAKADVDKRFENVDKRFDKVLESIEKLGDKIDNRDHRQRNFTLRMFSLSVGISILGVLGVFLKSFGII